MSVQKPNLAASIHQRLLNQSKARGLDFNLLLARFAIERSIPIEQHTTYESVQSVQRIR